MTTFIGNNGVVKTAADGGSATAMTEVRGFTIESSSDVIDCSVMGSLNRVFKAGMNTFTGTIDVYYDAADAEQSRLVAGANIDFELYPTGETESGSDDFHKFTGGGLVTGRTVTNTVDGMVEMTLTIQGSGALTEADIA